MSVEWNVNELEKGVDETPNRREQQIARRELRCQEAVVKSKLSYNLVKFEKDIKVRKKYYIDHLSLIYTYVIP